MILFMSAVFLPSTIAAIPSSSVAQQLNAQQLVQQAQQLYETGQFSNAIALWNQAAIAFEANGDHGGQAMALSNLSLTYQQLGQWSQATQAIMNSLALIASSKSSILILAQSLDVQGWLQFAQGKVESALATWKQAEQHYK